jgi:hypothetical protein
MVMKISVRHEGHSRFPAAYQPARWLRARRYLSTVRLTKIGL